MSQHSNPTLEVNSATRLWAGLVVLLVLLLKVTNLFGAQREEVTFPSGKLMLHGFLYRPEVKLLALGPRGRKPDFKQEFHAAITQRADALITLPDPVRLNRKVIVGLAAKNRLPVMYPERRFTEAGGLMSYGPSLPDLYRRTAFYVDKILKGANPANLPVEQPTQFELVINLKTAKEIGVSIDPEVLMWADRVIK